MEYSNSDTNMYPGVYDPAITGDDQSSNIKRRWPNRIINSIYFKARALHTTLQGSVADQPYPTFAQLIRQVNNANSEAIKIKKFRLIFESYKGGFEWFAISQLPLRGEKVQVELLKMLGRLNKKRGLEAVMLHLFSPNIKLSATAYVVLESLGPKGEQLVDLAIKKDITLADDCDLPRFDMRRHNLKRFDGAYGASALEKRLVEIKAFSTKQIRSLRAVTLRTGASFDDLLWLVSESSPRSV